MFKRSVVLKADKIKKITGFSFDYKTVIFFTLFVCGLVIGVTFVKKGDTSLVDFISGLLTNNLKARNDSSLFRCFCGDFIGLFLLVFIDFICGFCGVGLPFIWLVPVCFGSLAGVTLSLFYTGYAMTGLGYCALINIPCYAITAATLIKCCCESTRVSAEIFFYILGGKNDSAKQSLLKDYVINYILLCIPIIIAALIRAGSFKLFSGLFNLI